VLTFLLAVAVLLQSAPGAQVAKPSTTQATVAQSGAAGTDPAILLKVKRIYVESFGDDVISKEVQSMVVSSLVETKRFKVTENRERADAILKGVALEKSSQELHSYGESTAARGSAISDSAAHTETLRDTTVSVRLVNPEGDVIWTNTQESKGAKYKGASADVADKCVKQLLHDAEKLERVGAQQGAGSPATAATPTDHQ
jgi:curli biogenesis system outer membrane secretion channel CsgG